MSCDKTTNWSFEPSKFISFRDAKECARVRAIQKKDIGIPEKWHHPDFKIRVIETAEEFYGAYAADMYSRVKQARDEGRQIHLILPVGPMPQYAVFAHIVNQTRLPLNHVHTWNMDEYANEQGITAPATWEGSFYTAMQKNFFQLIAPESRPPAHQIHFPNSNNINDYSKMIADAGGADVCYGGIGWCGHIAFWESHLGDEFESLEDYKKAGARIVELNPMTIMQNALHSFSSDWSWVPPKAATIGPADILGARYRSFWLDGMCGPPGSMGWQRFIARLASHCYVNKYVPGSILQTAPGTYTILGGVAENVEINMA